jgi:hypothetical protein
MYDNGMGLHADEVEPARIVMMAKWLLVAEILYAWNLGWTKISLLLMYYRIFHVPYFKKMAWAVGGFVMAWVVCITFLFIFICVPVQKLWYPDLPGHCINQVGTWIANASSTIFTDLAILFLPIPQIWKLQLRTTEKMGLTCAFGLGFLYVVLCFSNLASLLPKTLLLKALHVLTIVQQRRFCLCLPHLGAFYVYRYRPYLQSCTHSRLDRHRSIRRHRIRLPSYAITGAATICQEHWYQAQLLVSQSRNWWC